MSRKIVVINSKGGCGKTTLSTNLAAYYASSGVLTALLDYDPQDSSMRWLENRSSRNARIHGVAATHTYGHKGTKSYQRRVPVGTERIILDTPASLKKMDLIEILRGVSAIVIPVLPSSIDSHVTVAFIRNLMSMAKIYAPQVPVAVVANRVRPNTKSYRALIEVLDDIGMTPVACLRDTQNYVQASEQGKGIHELHNGSARSDREQWRPLIEWLESPDPSQIPGQSRQQISASA